MSDGRDWVKEAVGGLRGKGDNVRDDIEAAKAAVDGTTTQSAQTDGPSVAEKVAMTDAQWRNYMEAQEAKAAQ